MKVVLVAPGFSRDRGGVQAYSSALAVALRRLGHECHSVDVAAGGRTSNVLAMFLAMIRLRPDVVLCTHLRVALPVVLASRAIRCRVVVALHGIEAWSVKRARDRIAIALGDGFVPVSPWTRDRFLDQFPRCVGLCDLLPNTFDPGVFRPGEARVPSAASGRGPVGLIVSRMDPAERYKGHDVLIDALPRVIRLHPNFLLAVVGGGDDLPRLRAKAATTGVAGHVHFAGPVPLDDLVSWYRGADVLVFPSTGEGFGIVALEAAACGTPVLGSSEAGLGFVIDALGESRIRDPVSAQSCAEGVLDLLSSLPESPTRVTARAARAIEHFGPERFQARLAEILNKLVPCVR